MKRTKSQKDLILFDINNLLETLISRSINANNKDIIQKITELASENLEMAQSISKILSKKSLEVNIFLIFKNFTGKKP